jgi:thiol-disulfide isomerase/thioredoxin
MIKARMVNTRMLKTTVFALACGLFALTVLDNASGAEKSASGKKDTPGNVAIGAEPPPALGMTLDGKEVSTKDYAGKILVVTFWASWCGPCKAELPILENLQNAGKGSIQVVAVNIEERDQFRRVARVLAPLKLQITHDTGKWATGTYGVEGIPHMVIIGDNGRVRNVHRGYGEAMIPQLVEEINAALAERRPAVSDKKESADKAG